ncbi:MAG: glycosyltransferase family 4 protein [Pseudomonadota bacterium]
MRILHVHDRWSQRGGADLHLLGVAAHQARHGLVDVCVGRIETDAPRPPGVRLHCVRGLGGREREAPRAAVGLAALAERLRPEVVHLHNALQPAVMAAAVALAPVVATVQDHRCFCPGRGRLLPEGRPCPRQPDPEACAGCFDDLAYAAMILDLTRRRAAALRRYRRVIVLSAYMAGELASAGLEPARIAVIPPFPWWPEAPAPSPAAPPYLLAAGRLVAAKGFHVLMDALARVPAAPPLLLVGDGPDRADLARCAATLPAHARLLPWQGRAAMRALTANAQALVMPSLWAEPFGIAGLEALSLGVPVVGSAVGGIPEWLDPACGWLVPPGDVGALAQALVEASDPTEAAARGTRGRARAVERFAEDELMVRLEAQYRAAIGEG